ncbi:helix-turn-helix domain-containing protein [Saccharibacter floricola]|uniref:helix-turn-helix domain-containing protein n=1 Tax=Saccharibacter floricola TaxID=231053 RepID=UPI0003A1DB1B|nr:helix-turn-helix transcriptional regulator [Saccharibacter floricola]
MKSIFSDRYTKMLQLLITARKEKPLTQVELARQLKKPQSFVSKYELGERRIDVIEFMVICEAISTDPCDIIRQL